MSAFGTKQTSPSALHMSAFDPSGHQSSFQRPRALCCGTIAKTLAGEDKTEANFSDYLTLISPKRLRNPGLVIETRRWARPTKVHALCGIQFLPLRSTTISNWQLLI